jgi:hypothetical protein
MGSAVAMVGQVTSITVETYYQGGAIPTVTGYPANHTTYRIYANCTNPTDLVSQVKGSSEAPLTLSVPGGIWNHPSGSSTAENLSCAISSFVPAAAYDSYVTLSKACDTDGAGQIRIAPSDASAWLDPYFGSAAVPYGPGLFQIQDLIGASWFGAPGLDQNIVAGPDLKVLLAQITTTGGVCGVFNLQVFPNYTGVGSPAIIQNGLTFGACTPGCTDNTALNFDPTADLNDGSCLFSCALDFTTSEAVSPTCAGLTDGSITFEAQGFQEAVRYTINGGSPFLGNGLMTRADLANGTYVINARDTRFDSESYNPGHLYTCETTITLVLETAPIAFGSLTSTNVTCGGQQDGCVVSSATGGTGDLTFGVVNNANGSVVIEGLPSADFCGLSGGTYTLVATDANNCAVSTPAFTITSPAQLILLATTGTAATCADTPDGVRVITWSGGTGDVDFSLANDGTYEIEGNLSNAVLTLTAGQHTVYAQDTNLCTASLDFTVAGPAPISISYEATTPSCVGDSNGSVAIVAEGGNGGFSYVFNNGASQNNGDYSGLSAGIYSIAITDANGCTANGEVVVNDPAALEGVADINNISCFGLVDGSIMVGANGGTAPYTYSFDGVNYGSLNMLTSLPAGMYSYYVLDANGCSFEAVNGAEVIEPALLTASLESSNISCNGSNDGAVVAQANGGTAPFTYSIGGAFTTNNIFGGLSAGDYTVSVVDVNGCSAESAVGITEPAAIVITGLEADPIDETPGGSSAYTVTGGTGAYSYSWTNSAGSEVSTNEQLGPFTNAGNSGTYTLTVTDINGCSTSQTISITGVGELGKNISVSLNPNPNNGNFVLNIQGLAGERLSYQITDTQGRIVTREELGNATGNRTKVMNLENIADGMYYVQIVVGQATATVKMIKQ